MKGKIRQQNEEKIIKAAIESFSKRDDSIERIADRAGVPKANVHYYFGSKNDLYEASVQAARLKQDKLSLKLLVYHYLDMDNYGNACLYLETLTRMYMSKLEKA